MRRKIKFIHAADLHLGSILHIDSKEHRELFNNATYDAFENLCSTALAEDVDFMVLSGDVYDRQARSVRANKFFIEQCLRLKEKNIRIYVIGGNHDPLLENSELFKLPSNVYLFGSEKVEVLDFTNREGIVTARILGQSYRGRAESRKMFEKYETPDNNVFNIAMLHTQLDKSNNNYVPCSLEDLKSIKNIDYWALGHIHKFNILNYSNPVVAYPGIPQGRDLGEEDLGGALLVEMEENKETQIKFINTASVLWKRVEVNIEVKESPQNITELENLIAEKGEELLKNNLDDIKGYVVQWIIVGRGDIHNSLIDREEEFAEVLTDALNNTFIYRNPFIVTDSIVLRTKKQFVGKDTDNEIFRELEDLICSFLEDDRLRDELVSSLGSIWEASSDSENINEQKLQLNEDTLNIILSQAKELVLEKLIERTFEDEDKGNLH